MNRQPICFVPEFTAHSEANHALETMCGNTGNPTSMHEASVSCEDCLQRIEAIEDRVSDAWSKMSKVVKVVFANSRYNFRTNINGKWSDIVDYYSQPFDVGPYPKENIQKPIAVLQLSRSGVYVVRHAITH